MALIPLNFGVPTGTIMWSAAPDVPVGWLLCDGRRVAKGDYPVLADFLGDEFGAPDPTSFALPNLVGRFIRSVGEPGRDAFTYQDGLNGVHSHGMFPGVTHTHDVTDPGHLHDLTGGDHTHFVISDHTHNNTSVHTHGSAALPGHGYFPNTYNCAREVFINPQSTTGRECGQDPADVMVTQLRPTDDRPGWTGKTGITAVNASVTGVTLNIAMTGVTMGVAFTGITADPALTNIVIEEVGDVGGPVPFNLALLPIIRT